MTVPNKPTNRLRANASLSAIQVVVGAGVLFVLFRFIVQTLGTEAIGLWSLVMAVTTAVRLGELGLGASSIRFVPMHIARGLPREAAAAASTAMMSVAVLVLILCVIAWPLLHWGVRFLVDSPADLTSAHALLPYAIVSIWLAAVSNSLTTALVGCHRADLSSLLQMAGQLLWLGMGFLLVPRMGLEGLAIGQAIQYLFMAFTGWLLLGRELHGFSFWLPKWSRERFIEMWRYGLTQQFISLAALLGEPLAKVLLAHFGNLSLLGLFEMANRLVNQLRMLLVSANRVMVPHYADLSENTGDGLKQFYIRNVQAIALLGSILFSLLAAGLPAIGLIWIGQDEPWFWAFGMMMCFGWFVNLLGAPAFFFNAGVGRLGDNLITQFLQSSVLLIAGIIAGSIWGAGGAALAWPIGLTAGTVFIIMAHSRREHIRIYHIFGSLSVAAAILGAAVTFASLYVYQSLPPEQGFFLSSAAIAGIGLVGWLGFFAIVPQARELAREVGAVSAKDI